VIIRFIRGNPCAEVQMKKEVALASSIVLASTLLLAQSPDSLYTEVLGQYVSSGKVNYRELCKDKRLQEYIAQLSAQDPSRITGRNAKLAFWINAYNAYTLKVICDHYPIKSINELHSGGPIIGRVLNQTIWDKDFVVIGGRKMTLNRIEHEIIRKEFKDPRAHFALVCASKSCPSLRPEAFEGDRLEDQLNDQTRIFFSETNKNSFETENRRAHLSKILDWYAKDFGKNDAEVLLFVSKFVPAASASAIREAPQKWKIEYTHYDWSLNE
jgi:hypothetical protein